MTGRNAQNRWDDHGVGSTVGNPGQAATFRRSRDVRASPGVLEPVRRDASRGSRQLVVTISLTVIPDRDDRRMEQSAMCTRSGGVHVLPLVSERPEDRRDGRRTPWTTARIAGQADVVSAADRDEHSGTDVVARPGRRQPSAGSGSRQQLRLALPVAGRLPLRQSRGPRPRVPARSGACPPGQADAAGPRRVAHGAVRQSAAAQDAQLALTLAQGQAFTLQLVRRSSSGLTPTPARGDGRPARRHRPQSGVWARQGRRRRDGGSGRARRVSDLAPPPSPHREPPRRPLRLAGRSHHPGAWSIHLAPRGSGEERHHVRR